MRHRLIIEGEVTVRQSFELYDGDAAGAGVHAVIDVSAITVAVIEKFNYLFQANRECG